MSNHPSLHPLVKVHPTAEVSPLAKIGNGTSIWHFAQVREGVQIGERCNIVKNVYIDAKVKIGAGCKIQNNVSVYFPCTIEDDVFVGPSVTFSNDLYPRAFIWDDSRHTPLTHLKKGCSVGADAIILGGVTIGEFAMVGAGSVVTRSVPPHALVYGNPARIAGFVGTTGEKLELVKVEGEMVHMRAPHENKSYHVRKADWEKIEKNEWYPEQ